MALESMFAPVSTLLSGNMLVLSNIIPRLKKRLR